MVLTNVTRLRWLSIWQRNYRVWRKLLIPSLLGNFADPLIYLLVLGYGLGRMVGETANMPYSVYLASGIVASSAMYSASFECFYSAYTRMTVQQTWQAMLVAPLSISDIVKGEVVWASSKCLINAIAIVCVAGALSLFKIKYALLAFPVVFLAGLAFASFALCMTALAPSYDFFLYYNTLILTPMLLLSGVFFPTDQLPTAIWPIVSALPLSQAISIIRPLLIGQWPSGVWIHLLVLASYAFLGLWLAERLIQRRLQQ